MRWRTLLLLYSKWRTVDIAGVCKFLQRAWSLNLSQAVHDLNLVCVIMLHFYYLVWGVFSDGLKRPEREFLPLWPSIHSRRWTCYYFMGRPIRRWSVTQGLLNGIGWEDDGWMELAGSGSFPETAVVLTALNLRFIHHSGSNHQELFLRYFVLSRRCVPSSNFQFSGRVLTWTSACSCLF